MEIYFEDLNEEKQAEVLEYLGLKDASDGNYDTFPLFVLPKED